MQILAVLAIVLIAIWLVLRYRKKQDREMILARIREGNGELVALRRVKKGSPYADTTRGWWAWRVEWTRDGISRLSWVLTTREGIKEWRD